MSKIIITGDYWLDLKSAKDAGLIKNSSNPRRVIVRRLIDEYNEQFEAESEDPQPSMTESAMIDIESLDKLHEQFIQKKEVPKKAKKETLPPTEVVWSSQADPRPVRPETKAGILLGILQEGKSIDVSEYEAFGYPSRGHIYRKIQHLKNMGYGLLKTGSVFTLLQPGDRVENK